MGISMRIQEHAVYEEDKTVCDEENGLHPMLMSVCPGRWEPFRSGTDERWEWCVLCGLIREKPDGSH